MKNARTNSRIDIIKANIKSICKNKDTSIEELCMSLKVNRNFISRLKNPGINKLINIADKLDCKLVDLLEGL